MTVLDLGEQALTGVFPASAEEQVSKGPLELVWCSSCTLLQLAHSYEPAEMYGDNYGYRSGLNRSMLLHLARKARGLEALVGLNPGDVVLDVGSNDGTLLGAYATSPVRRIGIDPTAARFADYYPPDAEIVADFFSAREVPRGQRRPSADRYVDRDVLRRRGPGRVRSRHPRLPRARWRLALRAVLHAFDAALDGVRHRLSRTHRVLLPCDRPPDPRRSRARAHRRSVQPGERRQLRRHRRSPRLAVRAKQCAHRLVRGPGRAHGARHARPVQTLRGEGLPTPHGPHPACQDTSFGRCVRDGLRGLDEGKRPPSVLRVRPERTSKQSPRSTRTSSGASRRDRESRSSRKTR